jgi:hypothetical protein
MYLTNLIQEIETAILNKRADAKGQREQGEYYFSKALQLENQAQNLQSELNGLRKLQEKDETILTNHNE